MAEPTHGKNAGESAGRPTLRMIAREAGLSLTATSLALRNHTGVGVKTRERVQALAKQMGYHPDPKLATLMQHLRLQKNADYHETIAFLSSHESYDAWKMLSQHDFYLGAVGRAAELGYRVELFHLGQKGMTPARMSNLLVARGIRGVLVGSFTRTDATLDIAWADFAAVTFGYSLRAPVLHRVTTDYYREMLFVLELLRKEGCRRIGLCIDASADAKALNLWRSAYLLVEDGLPADGVRIPPFNAMQPSLVGGKKWLREHKPDAVISAGCDFPLLYERAYGKPPPTGVRYVNMNMHHADARSRGIDQDSWSIGRLACGHLVTMLQRNELGLPEQPQIIAVKGRWVENYAEWVASLGARTKPREQEVK